MRQDSDTVCIRRRSSASWEQRITVVLRAAPEDGGYEAVVTEGAPYGVRISASDAGHPYDAYAVLIAALMRLGFGGEILLEEHLKSGRVRREVLR